MDCRCVALAAVSLKPDTFEGMRFDITKPLNHNFALSHRYDWKAWLVGCFFYLDVGDRGTCP
jgi:hypothetical protein